MVVLLGFADASMVANLIVMIVQGGHEIFIHKFEVDAEDRPQYLAHMDSGYMKVKVALSICSITLVQLLKDFVNLEHIEWMSVQHRMFIHGIALCSALTMAIIWRVTHPNAGQSHPSETKVKAHNTVTPQASVETAPPVRPRIATPIPVPAATPVLTPTIKAESHE